MNTNVAIIGSTGQNAAAWTDAFIAAGFTVRNLVRFPERLAKRPGLQYSRLDLDDSATFQPALKGIHTLGLITPSHPDQVEREVGLIYAAKQAGVRRIIKLSVIGADFICPISAFARWHADVEDVLRISDANRTLLLIAGLLYFADRRLCRLERIPDTLPFYSWSLLSSVEVTPAWPTSTVIALGDSITDGVGSTQTLNDRWPDLLAAHLHDSFNFFAPSVVNQGIIGNRLLNDITGQNALTRFDRDVLSQAGVRCVIIEEGLNDVATAVVIPNEAVTASQIIWALTQLIQRGYDQGLTVIGVTLGPFAGSFLYSAAGETERQAVHQFIRTGHLYDGVLDFDQVLRDPSNPTQLLPAYDSGDHVHPNDAGSQAIVGSIDLTQFLFFGLQR